ncbi:hypothetical protein JCM16408A_57750 [Methylobacterium phyllosphaerae]
MRPVRMQAERAARIGRSRSGRRATLSRSLLACTIPGSIHAMRPICILYSVFRGNLARASRIGPAPHPIGAPRRPGADRVRDAKVRLERDCTGPEINPIL